MLPINLLISPLKCQMLPINLLISSLKCQMLSIISFISPLKCQMLPIISFISPLKRTRIGKKYKSAQTQLDVSMIEGLQFSRCILHTTAFTNCISLTRKLAFKYFKFVFKYSVSKCILNMFYIKAYYKYLYLSDLINLNL